jgi:hypothetical protein
MDDLEGARRMGREGQQPFNLSLQERAAFDQGKRDRENAMNFGRPAPGGGGGGGGGEAIGALMLLAMIAPAFAAPGLAMWATWMWFAETQGWDWPVLAAICVAEGIAFLFLFGLLWRVTPKIIVSVVLSLYLGVSYPVCLPMLIETGFMLTAVLAMAIGAVGFWAGLNAPNRLLSSFIVTSAAAIGLGVFLNQFAVDLMFGIGQAWLSFPLKWAGAGLALGAILRIVFKNKFAVLGLAAAIAAALFLAPGLLGEFANAVTGASMMFYEN